MNSKWGILLLLLLLFLIMGVVNAVDDNNETILTTNNNAIGNCEHMLCVEGSDVSGSSDSNDTLRSSDNEVILTDEGTKPLSELTKLVKATPDELVVENDYVLDSTGGLVISKSNFVLDFNGYTVNIVNKAQDAITINGDNVTVKNLKMIGNRNANYWAFVWNGNYGKLTNCNFSSIANLAQWNSEYGLVEKIQADFIDTGFEFYGNYATIRYVNVDNHGNNYHRFIYSREASYLTLHDFNIRNHWTSYGETYMGVFLGPYSKIYNSNFNHVRYSLWLDTENEVYNCTFTNQTGEVTVDQPSIHIYNCTFEDSTTDDSRRPIYASSRGINSLVEDCVFKNTNGNYILNSNNAFGMTVKNCTFLNLKLTSIVSGAGFKAFEDCNFVNCNTTSNFASQAISLIKDCNFTDVNAPGFYDNSAYAVEINSCNFNNVKFTNYCFRITNANAMYRMYDCVFHSAVEFDGFVILSTIDGAKINEEGNTFNNVSHVAILAPNMDTSKFTKLYVSSDGVDTNSGTDKDHPITFDTALNLIEQNGEIILLEGTYDVRAKTIAKAVNLTGKGAILNNNHAATCFSIGYSGIVIKNITFINNGRTNDDAGCIKIGTNINLFTVENCTFINNQGRYAGVFMGNPSSSKLSYIKNCVFRGNHATSSYYKFSAGAILMIGQLSHVVNCTFENNYAQGAGAVYVGVATTGDNAVTSYSNSRGGAIEDCIFKGNYATATSEITSGGYGGTNNHVSAGAVVFSSPDGYIYNCTFEDNRAYSSGAVYMKYGDNVTKCTFINNHAVLQASALYMHENSYKVVDCKFIGNDFDGSTNENQQGTLLFIKTKPNSGTAVASGCVFEDNTAKRGSAIYCDLSNFRQLIVSDSNFTGNVNLTVYLGSYGGRFTNCNFTNNINNVVVSDITRATNAKTLEFEGCKFENNNGTNGSAIYSILQTSIKNSDFIKNNGSAVLLYVDSSNIANSNFIENTGSLGSAVCVYGDDNIIEYCTFIGNVATSENVGGGAIYVKGDGVTIFDSIFNYNNATHFGGAIYIDGIRYYYVNNVSRASFKGNTAFDNHIWDDIYDENATAYLGEVYVVLYPNSIINNNFTGNITNPVSFDEGLRIVSPEGSIIFINGSEKYLNADLKEINKNGVKFMGNNTTFYNHRFIINARASGVEFHNFIFRDSSNSTIVVYSSGCLVDNCSFVDNGGDFCIQGGAMQVFGDNLTINNTNFISNSVSNPSEVVGGGALFVNASYLSILNCTFISNAANEGANIYLTEDCENILINSSVFKESNVVDTGIAGIVIKCSNVDIMGCNFTNNRAFNMASYDGGVLFVEGNLFYINILNNLFINNSAHYGGAIIFNGNPRSSVSNNVFINNSANYGGAVYCAGGLITIGLSNFYNNSALNGSAIYIDILPQVTIEDSSFACPKFDENNNLIEGYVYSKKNITLRNDTLSFTDLNKTVLEANTNLDLEFNYKYFEDYDAPFQSGVSIDETLRINGHSYNLDGSGLARVFRVSVDNVDLSNLTFVDAHVISGNGGAILWSGSDGRISDSFFINCSAVNAGSAWNYGGAVCVSGANMNITDCAFDSCVSNVGSALRINSSNSVITNCIFTNNNADQYDGAIWYDGTNSGDFILSDCIFRGNNASRWGGALRADSKGSINNCIFENNAVVYSNKTSSGAGNGYGGAIYLTGNGVSITNSTFKGNYVDNLTSMCGGGIYASKTFTLNNCYFMNNSASNGSAIYYVSDSDLNIDSCTFANPRYDQTNNWLEGYIYSTHVINFNNITLSFTDLNHTIANSGDSLDLIFNYMFFNEFDKKFVSGVPISKDFTINGNSFILDGNHSARIFNVTGDNTVFSNLTFTNGNANLGGAIYVIGNITVLNSNFTNNNATLGGTIFIESGHSNLTNCIFDANNATNGSAIYVLTSINHWDNLDFINNIALNNATIYFKHDSTVYSDNLTFTNNIIPNMLNIVGENHIYTPIIYVNATRQGFGIIMSEPTSLTRAVDNIVPDTENYKNFSTQFFQ